MLAVALCSPVLPRCPAVLCRSKDWLRGGVAGESQTVETRWDSPTRQRFMGGAGLNCCSTGRMIPHRP